MLRRSCTCTVDMMTVYMTEDICISMTIYHCPAVISILLMDSSRKTGTFCLHVSMLNKVASSCLKGEIKCESTHVVPVKMQNGIW